jgi:hypothetical protein
MREHVEARHEKEWNELYQRLKLMLQRYGESDRQRRHNYYIVDENYGRYEHQIVMHKLHMLRPEIIKSLQAMLVGNPDWEISIAAAPPEKGDVWPEMELTLRDNEIIDGLKREYFPEEYRDLAYEGARPPKVLRL